jgi:hypothetical protein
MKRKARGARSYSASAAILNAPSSDMVSRLDVLTSAIELVTEQMVETNEKLQDMSDSISETQEALHNSMSLTPGGQRAASGMLNLSQALNDHSVDHVSDMSNVSVGSINVGADLSTEGMPPHSPTSSSRGGAGGKTATTEASPSRRIISHHNQSSSSAGSKNASNGSPVSAPYQGAAKEHVKGMIKSRMREKLSKFIATS